MDNQYWDAVEPILDKALELSKDGRREFIKYSCKGNPGLFDETIKLLNAIERSEEERFLDKASEEHGALIQNLTSEGKTNKLIGKQIGVFELTEQIGSGGMAAVFKAKRIDGQFEQQVAVKLIKSGIHSKEILQRFELEKQILANLSHPHIARLYDGGITDDGNPYLIMELILGMPIAQYCNSNRLTINERLELFKDVCQAVEYAHSNLIVHRDLKAGNIFVTESGHVKILDFGIAKLLDAKLTNKQLVETLPGQHIWTPQYASPEQVEGKTITTASDVYSLGVLLHKLLVGTYPYDFEGKRITQIYDQIKKEKSDTITRTLKKYFPEKIQKIADQRNTSIQSLKKIANGDLKAITYKTLQKHPGDRYSSVRNLYNDVNNYLHNRPVTAQKQTFLYHFKYFIRRYKKGFIAAATIVVVIASLMAYYTHRLSVQKKSAVYEAKRATTALTLLENILRISSPYGRTQKNISLDQLLAVGQNQIKNQLQGQPLLKAEMLGLFGEIYSYLGRYTEAKPMLEKALKLQSASKKPDLKLQALNLNRLGYLLFRQGYFKASKNILSKAEATFRKSNSKNKLLQSDLYNNMGLVYAESGEREKAISLYEHALKFMPEENSLPKATTLGNLGILYQNMGKFKKSLRLLKENLSIKKKLFSHSTPQLANAYNNLAFTYQRKGNLQKADSLHRIALTMREKVLPAGHPHIASSLIRYGLVKVKQGKLKEAEQMFERAYHILKNILPDDHWQVLSAKGGLALARGLQGDLESSIPVLKNVYSGYKNRFGASDWRTKTAHHALQTLLLAKQKRSKFKPVK